LLALVWTHAAYPAFAALLARIAPRCVRKRRDRLVHSQEHGRMIVEHDKLEVRFGVVRPEWVAGRQQPTPWAEDA
jgi:hypothetical protein